MRSVSFTKALNSTNLHRAFFERHFWKCRQSKHQWLY